MARGSLQAAWEDVAAGAASWLGGSSGWPAAAAAPCRGCTRDLAADDFLFRHPFKLRTSFNAGIPSVEREQEEQEEKASPLGGMSDEQLSAMEADPDHMEDVLAGKPTPGPFDSSSDPGFVPVPGGPQQPPRKANGHVAYGLNEGQPSFNLFGGGEGGFNLEDAMKASAAATIKVPPAWSVKCNHPFLRFARKSQWLEDTDITCPTWISQNPSPCDVETNIAGKEKFFHPSFKFKVDVHRVEIRLGPEGKDPYWDVIYSGPPGPDDMVTNEAVPTGGKKMVFPYFCPPIQEDSRWTLRITDASKNHPPRFDEVLTLKVAPNVPVERGPDNLPRPHFALHPNAVSGPLESYGDDDVLDDVNVETGEKLKSFL